MIVADASRTGRDTIQALSNSLRAKVRNGIRATESVLKRAVDSKGPAVFVEVLGCLKNAMPEKVTHLTDMVMWNSGHARLSLNGK